MTEQEKDRKSVAVIMSSYNGELYIEEQINSILHQIGVDVYLYVRDDGSSDKTIQILEKYSEADNVSVEYGRHTGIGNSFYKMLCNVPETYDYYAFSDQDDIWEHDKLITAVRQLSCEHGRLLYASNLECVSAQNNSLGFRFDLDKDIDISLLSLICSNRCYGCTQVFNREYMLFLRSRMPDDQLLRTRLHDTWVSVTAAAAGKIVYDKESHIRYRRHGNNYTILSPSRADVWKARASNLMHNYKKNPRSKTARYVVQNYAEYIEKDKDRDLIYILAYPFKVSNRIALIKNRKRLTSETKESDAWFITKVIIGWI